VEINRQRPLAQESLKLTDKATGRSHLSRAFASILRPLLPRDHIFGYGRFWIEAQAIELSI
jgi:hypothetical protein